MTTPTALLASKPEPTSQTEDCFHARKWRLCAAVALLVGLPPNPLAMAQESPKPVRLFALGQIVAHPGDRADGFLQVPLGANDNGTKIPVSLFHGPVSGPVVAVLAGVHGAEYPPILGLQKARDEINPTTVRGTVILVLVANLPSFVRRTVYYGPIDGKNLGRVFPGNPEGTLSERIANVLISEVIRRADYVIDLHAGDANERLRPYVVYDAEAENPIQVERSRKMALAFGLDHIIERRLPKDGPPLGYLSVVSGSMGKATLDVECGELGVPDKFCVGAIARGVINVLRSAGALPGNAPSVDHPVLLDSSKTVESPASGILRNLVDRDQKVSTGQLLAVVSDFFGHPLKEVRSPIDGIVLYVTATPAISEGESVACIGHLAAKASPRSR